MKWRCNDIRFVRGDYKVLIARFNNSKCWLSPSSTTTTNSAKQYFRELGKKYGAEMVEVKYAFDEDGKPTEQDVVGFNLISDKVIFSIEEDTPEGEQRKRRIYSENEIFTERN